LYSDPQKQIVEQGRGKDVKKGPCPAKVEEGGDLTDAKLPEGLAVWVSPVSKTRIRIN